MKVLETVEERLLGTAKERDEFLRELSKIGVRLLGSLKSIQCMLIWADGQMFEQCDRIEALN